jgi:hypothetical protein
LKRKDGIKEEERIKKRGRKRKTNKLGKEKKEETNREGTKEIRKRTEER